MSMPVGEDKPWFCASYCDEFTFRQFYMSMPVGGDKPWFCASYCDEFICILIDNFTCPCRSAVAQW